MMPENNASSQDESVKGSDTYFWPILILIIGTLVSSLYQVVVMEGQIASLQGAVAQLEPKVKQAEYEKAKLYKLASDVLQLASTDPIAKQIVTDYKIEHKAPSQPMGVGAPGQTTP